MAYVAATIDGRISLQKRTQPNWTSKEDWNFFQDSLAISDAVVVGRNTYLSVKERLEKRNAFVLTSKVKTIQKKDSVTFVNPKTVTVGELLKEYKNVAIAGGPRVYQTMLNLGLLDELYVTIEPLIFGQGVAMFEGGLKNHTCELLSVKKLNASGTLLLRYRIKKTTSAKSPKNSKKPKPVLKISKT